MYTTQNLARELVELARAGDALAAAAVPTPHLERLALGEPGLDAIHDLISQAADRLDSIPRAAALEAFGLTDRRFVNNFSARRQRAGELLGIGESSFRRRRPIDGASPFDDLAEQLAAAILAGESSAASDDGPAVAGPDRKMIAATAVAAALVIGVGTLLLTNTDDPARDTTADPAGATMVDGAVESPVTTSSTISLLDNTEPGIPIDGCDIPIGAAVSSDLPPHEIAEAAALAYRAESEAFAVGCPDGLMERWGELWVQDIAMADGSVWHVTVEDEAHEHAFVVSDLLFHGYWRVLDGENGTQAQTFAGLPREVDNDPGEPRITTSNGSIVVAENLWTTARWMPPEAAEIWSELGGPAGPGYPITDGNFVSGVMRQEFQHGFGEIIDGEVQTTIFTSEELAADVASLPRQTEIILGTFDRNSWWIDEDGIRHWIRDPETWHCLGGAEVALDNDVPGWVVGQFEVGELAMCAD